MTDSVTTMNHLTDVQMVDAAEGEIDSALSLHLSGCAACAAKIDGIREMRRSVADVPAPEPSPLFWEHFGARISAAIDAAQPTSGSWLSTARLAWLGAACLVLLSVIGFYVTGDTLERTPSQTVRRETATPRERAPGPASAAAEAVDAIEEDEVWAVVRSLAGDLHYDDAREAGVLPRDGSVEHAATELSVEERAELVRLIQNELKRMGA